MARFFLFNAVACLSLASTGLSARLPPASLDLARFHARAGETSPCAQVANLTAIWNADPANGGYNPLIPAKVAYECLTSVPFNQTAALALVDAVKPFIEFHSTTAILKNPPADWTSKVRPAYDIWAELEKVRERVVSGSYGNEHEFGLGLFQVFQFAHDSHFQYLPDVVGSLFTFIRSSPELVSVAANKDSLPEIYSFDDITAEMLGNASFKASPITHINGQDAQSYLEKDSKWNYNTDLDAVYNSLFTSLPGRSQSSFSFYLGAFTACGDMSVIYPGPTTEFRFANGTSASFENHAQVYLSFDGITDGETLYQSYFSTPKIQPQDQSQGQNQTSDSQEQSNETSTPPPLQQLPGYPPPIVFDHTISLGGYYLDDDHSDVAVLSVPDFSDSSDPTQTFRSNAEKFIAGAKAAGKKKLIIDLSINPGGQVPNAYTLFKILFPHGREHSSAGRFRAFEASKFLTEKFSKVGEQYPLTRNASPTYGNTTYDTNYYTSTEFSYGGITNQQGENFKGWKELYGPGVTQNGASFSNLFHFNLSNPWTMDPGPVGFYASYAKAQQPFPAGDIVVLTDGQCGSTCADFVDLIRTVQKVRTVAIGGRPRQGLMQAIGSTKGSRSLDWLSIGQYMYAAIEGFSTPEESERLQQSDLGRYIDVLALERQADASQSNINFLDAIRDGDESNTPLQFVYEPADCRILYTKEMVVDISVVWKTVADSAWAGKSYCSAGSLGSQDQSSRRALYRRELSQEEREHTEKVQAWRRNLKPEDFAVDTKVGRDIAKSRLSKGLKRV